MARYCRDRDFVLTFWKQTSRDSSCPWALRVYCVNELAKAAKVAVDFPTLPGTYKPPLKKLGVDNDAVEPPTEVEVEAADAVEDVKQFLKHLGGANGDPQT